MRSCVMPFPKSIVCSAGKTRINLLRLCFQKKISETFWQEMFVTVLVIFTIFELLEIMKWETELSLWKQIFLKENIIVCHRLMQNDPWSAMELKTKQRYYHKLFLSGNLWSIVWFVCQVNLGCKKRNFEKSW